MKMQDNSEMLDSFLTNPYHSSFTGILADLVSLTYEVRVCIYTLSDINWSELNCTYYTNNKERQLQIFKMVGGWFFSLQNLSEKSVTAEEDQAQEYERKLLMSTEKVTFFLAKNFRFSLILLTKFRT